MESERFDSLISGLTVARSRRVALLGLVGGALGLLSVAESDAKKKHRKHKKKKQGGSSSPPPPVTCSDGIKNGTETDVDCGGKCSRCTDGRTCSVANDCVSGTCTGGTCVTCADKQLCGSDGNGPCQCNRDVLSQELVCNTSDPLGFTVQSCSDCPAGTEVCVTINGLLFNCYKRCGSA